ncbi:MAG: DUF3368 domain-containing protein [Cyclobacteriaceae bacterium]|nr:DUF3368 domain-containing protein [Cyclobacteriaceae bacterium]
MKTGMVIADAGPVFSLAIIDKLNLLEQLFNGIAIPEAVWQEITLDKTTLWYSQIELFFQSKVHPIAGFNELMFTMDKGESESVLLYKELNADYLLVDDNKARKIAENLGVNCIGTLGLLVAAKQKKLITELKPLFETFLKNKRYYSPDLLNEILIKQGEVSL